MTPPPPTPPEPAPVSPPPGRSVPTAVARLDLHDGWSVRALRGPVPAGIAGVAVPARVPGCVHTDLLAGGLIPDPYLDDHEAGTAWIGLSDWEYTTEFWAPPGDDQRHELVFEGLDTVARVALNGEHLFSADNMHRTWCHDVTGLLREGTNTLVVTFASPVRHANAQAMALGPRPHANDLPYNAVRTMASSFGWDWGPVTATSGLWRPVRLESWTARLTDARTTATLEGDDGVLTVRVGVESTGEELAAAGLELVVRLADEELAVPVTGAAVEASLRLPDVERWWPVGYGEPRLYPVSVELRHGLQVVDAVTRRVGFRSVRWDTTPDADGAPFALVVNEQPVYVKGVNWITDDAFPHRVTRERYAARIDQAVSAHVNLIRVWGGGLYESDDFYDLCDERGVLTWQDFLFACAAYAEEEPLRSNVVAEVRDNLLRIAHHASLVALNGNNECLMGHEAWGWQGVLDGQTWGEGYYRTLLPALVAQYAPHLPYTPGSPFSPDGADAPPNDPAHGSTHLWEMWNVRDWTGYRAVRPRFVAEFGWQGPPAWTTLTRAVHDDPLTPESPGMLAHQKAFEGAVKLTKGLVPHVRVPVAMEDWHWAMQHNQAAAVRAALTHFRSLHPLNTGAVVWQLNDCWPVTSWAAVDGDGRPKPLLHAMRNAFAPRLVTMQPVDAGLEVCLVNDTADPWRAIVRLRRITFRGQTVAERVLEVTVRPRSASRQAVPGELVTSADPAAEVLVADAGGVRDAWFFAEPRDSALTPPTWTTSLRRDGDDWLLDASADVVVRDVCLLPDRLAPDAHTDTGLVTLLPGEVHTFRIVGSDDLALPNGVLPGGVLRSVNELVSPPGRDGSQRRQ